MEGINKINVNCWLQYSWSFIMLQGDVITLVNLVISQLLSSDMVYISNNMMRRIIYVELQYVEIMLPVDIV